MDHLKVDDRFKSWMRWKLTDREYAEKVMKALVELEDCTLLKVHPHAALPIQSSEDPEAMIGLIKGHDNEKDKDFLLAIFGDWDGFKDLSEIYIGALWGMYDPVSDRDFELLPDIYEAAFIHDDSEHPMHRVRWTMTSPDGDIEKLENSFDNTKINIVNIGVDSEILRIITGRKKDENGG